MDNNITIGLFGTCGNSKWRESFIKTYDKLNVNYFNPQVDDWKPELAQIEAEHLANDQIILFPVTSETYGLGSLGEVGFSILQAIKLDSNRDIVVMIDDLVEIDETQMTSNELTNHLQLAKESIKMRALVKQHLKKLNYPCIYLVDSLVNMMAVSMRLYEIQIKKQELKQFTI